MHTDANTDLTLVLGAGGKTGRRVADCLRAQGRAVRAVARRTDPRFDWQQRATWPAALDGVSQAYLAFQPDLAVPGALGLVQAFIDAALARGVRKLVLLSGRGEPEAEAAEDALRASGADWTILRCSWFSQNFSESFLLQPILAGEVALPVGDVGEPFVDADDIADVAVAALTQPGHARLLHELTGPRALGFRQAVEAIARATARPIRFVTLAPAEFRAALADARLGAAEIDLIVYLFTVVLDGRNARPTDGVQRVLGRPARSFEAYVQRTAAAGGWRG